MSEQMKNQSTRRNNSRPDTRFLGWILAACLVAFLSLACYGMFLGDASVLEFVMALVRDGLIGVLCWALGHYRSE